MAKTKKAQRDVYQEVTDQIVALLEAGTVPWRKPWNVTAPTSMSSGKPYRGYNRLILSFLGSEYDSPFWGTYKQITEQGGQIRKGEKSTLVTLWKRMERDVKDANGAPVMVDGKPETRSFMMVRGFNVFNACQADWADGMPSKFTPTKGCDFEPDEAAQKVADRYFADGPQLQHGWDRACYVPTFDQVQMPDATTFVDVDSYYSVLFHEAAHSTGAAKRLNRDGITDFAGFASHSYGFEELVAELTTAMVCATVGIETTQEASASYLANWIATIKGDPKLIIQAASQAQKAADLILGETYDPEGEG